MNCYNMEIGLMQNRKAIEVLSERWTFYPFKKILKDSSRGNLKIKTSDLLIEGSIPVIDQGKDFIAGFTNQHNSIVRAKLPLIVFGDHTRNLKYIDFDFAMGADGTKVLEVINDQALPKFIYYYLRSIKIADTGYNRHFKFIKDLVFPLPPLKTQQRIAAILDNAAALRDKTAQLLKEYDLLAQSIFLEMFGDPVRNPKGWNFEKLTILSPIEKFSVFPEKIERGTNYVGLDSIEKDTGQIKAISIVEEGELKSNKFLFKSKHILYGKLRPYLNKVANPNFEGICSTDIITLLPNEKKSNKPFITYYLKGPWHLEWAANNTTGANLPRLNMKSFSKLRIISPPIDLQNQFAEKIALIEQQKELAKQELKESEDLFNGLLQKAFKGELVGEEVEDEVEVEVEVENEFRK